MVFTCTFCDREFNDKMGLKIHLSQCAFKRTQVIENNETYNTDVIGKNIYSGAQEQIDTLLIVMQEKLPVVRDVNLNQPYLPHYSNTNKQTTKTTTNKQTTSATITKQKNKTKFFKK